MAFPLLADGIFDIDEALIRIATIIIFPLAIVVIGLALSAILKRRRK
jgi:hypothetical protein